MKFDMTTAVLGLAVFAIAYKLGQRGSGMQHAPAPMNTNDWFTSSLFGNW